MAEKAFRKYTHYNDYFWVKEVDKDKLINTHDLLRDILNPDRDATAPCEHKWKVTMGIFKYYKDCEKCHAKYEDVYPEVEVSFNPTKGDT